MDTMDSPMLCHARDDYLNIWILLLFRICGNKLVLERCRQKLITVLMPKANALGTVAPGGNALGIEAIPIGWTMYCRLGCKRIPGLTANPYVSSSVCSFDGTGKGIRSVLDTGGIDAGPRLFDP
jgi:hypothetical protein